MPSGKLSVKRCSSGLDRKYEQRPFNLSGVAARPRFPRWYDHDSPPIYRQHNDRHTDGNEQQANCGKYVAVHEQVDASGRRSAAA